MENAGKPSVQEKQISIAGNMANDLLSHPLQEQNRMIEAFLDHIKQERTRKIGNLEAEVKELSSIYQESQKIIASFAS
jgi:hypothetical protein